MSFIWEKSATWRYVVRSSRGSPGTFMVYSAVLLAGCWVAGKLVIQTTNPAYDVEGSKVKDKELAKLPFDQRALAQQNKAKLVELLKGIQQGEDDGSKYTLALNGKVFSSEAPAQPKVTYGIKRSGSTTDKADS